MEALGQLSPQVWLQHEDTLAVMAALTAKGATARFAGGCVRDALLGLPVNDVDIAINCPPDKTMELLSDAGIRCVPTGLDHGTVTAVLSEYSFEISTLRNDLETDGRHALVDYTDDWFSDAARRDLTINALYADLDGAVYDPFDGLKDLGARQVRFVGKAEERINEDILRILRFFRFWGRFGKLPGDMEALVACRKLAHRIPDLSGERIRSEMLRILEGQDPAAVLVLMRGEAVTPWLFSCDIKPGRLRVLAWLESRGVVAKGLQPDRLRRLAALLTQDDEANLIPAITALTKRWCLSNAEAKRLQNALTRPDGLAAITVDTSLIEARRYLYVLGEERYRDHVLLAWAAYRHIHGVCGPRPGASGTSAWVALLCVPETAPVPQFPITGKDVLDIGIPAGPKVGKILKELETSWVEDGFNGDRSALLAKLTGFSV